ncbi:MAG: autotransporter outer membrane beta-barrel domain-containing protein [bacterium]|nr:autotransporter outer membrane beta-barrel domain-containing protein [bacterium]
MALPKSNVLQKPTYKFTTSNYYNYSNDSLESLNTLRFSCDTPWKGTCSLDVGADINLKSTDEGLSASVKPASEAKYKQNFATLDDITISGYTRYRHIGESDQLRFSAGVRKKINDKVSIYADGHYTTKFDGKDKIGGWIGVDCKVGDKISFWAEPLQYNKTLGGKSDYSSNFGVTYKF